MYQCQLEFQPNHLTPAWLVDEGLDVCDLEALSLNKGITQEGHTLWVPDHATGVYNPYILQPTTWQALHQWLNGKRNFSTRFVDLLRSTDIAITDQDRQLSVEEWKNTIAVCQSSLKDGFTPVRGLLHPFQIGALRQYYRRLIRQKYLRLGDQQCPQRYVAYNEPTASLFHHQLTVAVSSLLGKPVKPSYCYFISYQAGSVLEKHVDREQCEYTLAMCLDFSPEPQRETPWPLKLDLSDRTVTVYQAIGDALLYQGREIAHSRAYLPEGCTSSSILFHYVDEEYQGSLS